MKAILQHIQPFEIECIVRILAAALCGLLIGIEREKRAKSAGIRTHILVAISSALMMAVSKYGFFDVIAYDGIDVDPSRIAAGVVSAIGFLGAGVIFTRKETTIGLTTAAGLWATVGVGIALGAGMYMSGFLFTALMLLVQGMLHTRLVCRRASMLAELSITLGRKDTSISAVVSSLHSAGYIVRSPEIVMKDDGLFFSCRLIVRPDADIGKLSEGIAACLPGSRISRLVIAH